MNGRLPCIVVVPETVARSVIKIQEKERVDDSTKGKRGDREIRRLVCIIWLKKDEFCGTIYTIRISEHLSV